MSEAAHPPGFSRPIELTRFRSKISPLVAEWLASLIRALRSIHRDGPNTRRSKACLEQLATSLAAIHVTLPLLRLSIASDKIIFAGDIVHENGSAERGLPAFFTAREIASLSLARGMSSREIERFVVALSADFWPASPFLPHVRAAKDASAGFIDPLHDSDTVEILIQRPRILRVASEIETELIDGADVLG